MKKQILITAILASLAMLAGTNAAYALDVPVAGQYDERVKTVNYNPDDVVKIVGHFGYEINIVLAEDEHVLPKGVYMGDSQAWQFGTLRNHLFVKPVEDFGATNMTVLTNKRHYTFELTSHQKATKAIKDMYYQVKFRYPQDEADKKALAAREEETKRRLAVQATPRNWNYMGCGAESLIPDAAYDDGTFTAFQFAGNREIPAIFIINDDGSESLTNRHLDGDTVKIQTLGKKFVLRKGNSVACVTNESFDPVGVANDTGSTVPNVIRTIKGEQ